MNYLALLCVLVAAVNAATEEMTLKDKITVSLEALLANQAQAMGVENCENKCDKVFNKFAYKVSVEGTPTYEYQACLQGCNKCTGDLVANTDKKECFTTCKNTDFKAQNILKGVIEPDKACIAGCIIQTCQVICAGGTTDSKQTPANKQFFYPNGGCSIKTQPYSQNADYVFWNSPNSGQGGDFTVGQCCSNALSLCDYVGSTTSTNYKDLLYKTGQFCADFVPSKTQADICSFYSNAQNCGGNV